MLAIVAADAEGISHLSSGSIIRLVLLAEKTEVDIRKITIAQKITGTHCEIPPDDAEAV
jgi:hypothetical protein